MARLRGYGNRAATRVVEGLIERLDIEEFRDKLVKSVSGGQRRRVDLAASLVVQPNKIRKPTICAHLGSQRRSVLRFGVASDTG